MYLCCEDNEMGQILYDIMCFFDEPTKCIMFNVERHLNIVTK